MLVPDRHTVVCLQAYSRMFTSMRSDVYKHTVDFLTAYYYE